MKKIVSISSLFLFLLFAPAAKAVNEVCTAGNGACPNPPNASLCTAPPIIQNVGGCPGGTVWIGSASTGQCTTPSYNPSPACAAGTNAFYCETNKCWTKPLPGPPAVCAQASVNTGSSLPCCEANQIAVRDATFPTGWKCTYTIPGLWMKNGLNAYYSTGNVGINTSTPAYNLDVAGNANATQLCIAGVCISNWTSASPWTVSGANVYRSSGDVGIGTSSPSAKLDVEVASGGAATIGSSANIATGNFALALGNGNNAFGESSIAMGTTAIATHRGSIAIGSFPKSENFDSTAIGFMSVASGVGSTAIGYFGAYASGLESTAIGRGTASGASSLAMGGSNTVASGRGSTAMGRSTKASGDYSTVMGLHTEAQAYGSTVLGQYNTISTVAGNPSPTGWIDDDPLFVIGNGKTNTTRSNAMTVLKNGNVGIGTASPSAKLDVDGTVRLSNGAAAGSVLTSDASGNATWQVPAAGGDTDWVESGGNVYRSSGNVGIGTTSPSAKLDVESDAGGAATIGHSSNVATGPHAVAMGYNTTASGWGTTATGTYTTSSGNASTAMGNHTKASSFYTTAMGNQTTASGNSATSMGRLTTASGALSVAMGNQTTAQAYASLVIGRYNVLAGHTTLWQDADPVFVIGNGDPDTAVRSNAMTVLKNGTVGIGTDNPGSSKLHVESDDGWAIFGRTNLWGGFGVRGETLNTNGYGVGGYSSVPSRFGYLGGPDYGAYAQYSDLIKGYLGGSTYGAYGQYDNSRYGYLGGTDDGAYAQYDTNNWGKLGTSNTGVVGRGSTYGLEVQNSTNSSRYGYLAGAIHGGYAQYDANNYVRLAEASIGIRSVSDWIAVYGVGKRYGLYGYVNNDISNNVYAGYFTARNIGTGTAYGVYSSAGVNYFAERVGIGTTAPTQLLSVNGSAYFAERVGIGEPDPTFRLQLPDTATAAGGRGRANAWTTYSDSRVKMNQKNLSYGLKEILALAPKSYDHYSSSFKDGNLKLENESAREIGLIAQEVYKFIPEAVNKPSDESLELWGMDYDKLAPVLINAIKELKAENDELKSVVCEIKPEAELCKK